MPASFEWLLLDVFHPLGSFRSLVRRDPATFWLRWAATFCADQGMPGSHVDGSRRGARDQEAQDALHYGGRVTSVCGKTPFYDGFKPRDGIRRSGDHVDLGDVRRVIGPSGLQKCG